MTVGGCIRQARKKAGLTQSQLAEQSGVATISIHQYESGKRQPRLEPLRQIALALGVTVSDLVDPSYWSTLTDEDKKNAFDPDAPTMVTPTPSARERINAVLDQLNEVGMEKAADAVEIIAGNPKYQRTGPQEGDKATPARTEGNDTAPPSDAPETPSEGE